MHIDTAHRLPPPTFQGRDAPPWAVVSFPPCFLCHLFGRFWKSFFSLPTLFKFQIFVDLFECHSLQTQVSTRLHFLAAPRRDVVFFLYCSQRRNPSLPVKRGGGLLALFLFFPHISVVYQCRSLCQTLLVVSWKYLSCMRSYTFSMSTNFTLVNVSNSLASALRHEFPMMFCTSDGREGSGMLAAYFSHIGHDPHLYVLTLFPPSAPAACGPSHPRTLDHAPGPRGWTGPRNAPFPLARNGLAFSPHAPFS